MKRDMDLVRHILMRTEESDGPLDIEGIAEGGGERYTLPLVAYHVELMKAHGLIDAKVNYAWGREAVGGTIDGLTWDGADYLDAIRDGGVWSRTKKVVSESVGSTTIDVIKQAAILVATQAIKAKLGIAP